MPSPKSYEPARATAASEAAATQLLLSVGFTCPFLLPSFFVRRNARQVKYRRPGGLVLQQKSYKTYRAGGVETLKCVQTSRTAALDVAPSNAQAELESASQITSFEPLIRNNITCLSRTGIVSTLQLWHSISPHRGSSNPQRLFSSTASSSARSPPRTSGNSIPSRISPLVRSNGGEQRKRYPPIKISRNENKAGNLKSSPEKALKSSSSPRTGSWSKLSTPADASSTVSHSSPAKKSSSTHPLSQKPKPKPKWVKAGISRTKVKPTGRKARRTAKKENKANCRELDVTSNVISERLDTGVSSVLPFDMEAYETAVLEGGNSWKKVLASTIPPPKATEAKTVDRGVKGTSQMPNKGLDSKKQTRAGKQISVKVDERREAADNLIPGVGSRISVRGDGRIERIVGKGRNVLGTTPIISVPPIENKRFFGTWTGRAMEEKHMNSSQGERSVGVKGAGTEIRASDTPAEVKNTPPENSEIPKSQFLQAENPPILEGPQQIQAPFVDHQPSTAQIESPRGNPPSATTPARRTKRLRSKLSVFGDSRKSEPIESFVPPPDTISLPTSTIISEQHSKLLGRILSSPNIEKWYKNKPEFWLETLKTWYLPHDINCLFRPSIGGRAKIGGKVKQTLAANIFSVQYPPPIFHENHAKLGASPIDVIELLEDSRRNGIDILVELARKGEYSAIRWIVRRILHPQIGDVQELQGGGVGDVLGSFNWANEEKSMKTNIYEELSAAQGSGVIPGLLAAESLSEQKTYNAELINIKLARQGLGLVLGSAGTMLVYGDPSTLTAHSKTPFFSQSNSMINEYSTRHHTKASKLGDYTLLLPITKEILAYLHNSSLIPSHLYSPTLNPRLFILKTRILTGLADAVWRHQELAASEAAKEGVTEVDANQAIFSPALSWKLHGYWRGGFETLTGDYPQWRKFWGGTSSEDKSSDIVEGGKNEVLKLEEMANRGEREVLLELVLRACILAGYGHAGSLVLSHIIAQGGWSWIDYATTWPEEYRFEDLALREESESTDGLPGEWGVRGYAVVPPPVRTISKSLPRELITDMAAAIIDTTAEGKGLRQVISDLDRLGTIFGRDRAGLPSLISRVVHLWETECVQPGESARIGELVLHFIERWSGVEEMLPGGVAPGESSAELQVWYKVLLRYIDLENIEGAERVWGKMEERVRLLVPRNTAPEAPKRETITHYFHPPWVLASYLTILNQNKKIKAGLSLLSPKEPAPFPVIPKQYYHLPPLTPSLIALATLSKNMKLLQEILSLLPFRQASAVPHTTLTSILNAYLRIGDFASAQEVITYIKAQGLSLDGVDIAVLIENALRRDKEEGYRFAEQTAQRGLQDDPLEHIPPNLRVRSEWGNWELPFRAAAGKRTHNFTIFEGQWITMKSTPKPRTVPPPKMSPSGWLSILNHAIESNDRNRTEWALKGLGVDLRRQNSLSTKVFNILLKGVVMRNGAKQGWNMIMEHCVRDRESGKPKLITIDDEPHGTWVRITGRGREWQWMHGGKNLWGVRADVITFNTVLDEALREKDMLAQEDKLEWQRYWENGGWEGEDPRVLQGSDLLKLLDVGLGGERIKNRAEELQLWKKGMEDRKRRRQEVEHLVKLCRERLNLMGGL